MAETGKNQVISFASTVYACLNTGGSDGTSNTIETECSTDGTGAATTNKSSGTPSWTTSATIVIPGDSSTIPAALNIGSAGALLYYPHGDEVGAIEYSWAAGNSEVESHSIASSTSTHMTLDITWANQGAATIGVKGA